MTRQMLSTMWISAALGLAGLSGCQTATASKPATAAIPAVDLHNTVCPVSGDAVGTSKIVEVYDGKVYHLCCPQCPADFEKNPSKYEAAVAADPAKYGVKQQ